jgi:Tfp pilus assembly protein PilO
MNRLRPLLENWRYAARHPVIKTVLASLSLLVIMAGVAFGYWWPAEREHRSLMAQIDTQRRAAVEALQAAEIARAYRTARSAIEVLEQKLNASGGQADLVKSIERIAAKRRVRIVSQAYEEAKAKGEYSPLYLDIGLQADYSSLREFLADLHTLPVWIEVQEMNLQRSREHAGLIKAGLRLLTYRKAANRKVALAP